MIENLTVIVIIIAIIYVVVASDKIKLRKKEKERQVEADKLLINKKKLEDAGDYSLIRNFIIKYGYVDSDSNLQFETSLESGLQYFDQLPKLEELLDSKGYTFDQDEIKQLLKDAFLELKYESFHEKMLANRPNTINDCVKNLVDIYGDDYTLYLKDFWELLGEGEFTYDEEEVRDRISKAIKNAKLKHFEDKLKSNDPSYSIADIDSMTGFEFEGFLKRLFENMGYKVEHTSLSGDQGADLVVDKHDKKTVIQAKRNANSVGNKAIQEIVAAISHYGANRGMVVTNSKFTRSAVALAESNTVQLIDRSKLSEWIAEYL